MGLGPLRSVGGGAGALAASLASMGIPKDKTIRCEAEIKANRYLLIASGSPDEVNPRPVDPRRAGGEATVHAD